MPSNAAVKILRVERQKSQARLFNTFIGDRGLDMDPDTWSEADQLAYSELVKANAEEWRKKIKHAKRP